MVKKEFLADEAKTEFQKQKNMQENIHVILIHQEEGLKSSAQWLSLRRACVSIYVPGEYLSATQKS
jgi:hypothetical protein